MEYTVERTFYDLKHTCLGWAYQNFDDVLKSLIYAMRDKVGHPFIGKGYYNLRFIMNPPFYHEFYRLCQMSGHAADMYRGIHISPDPSLYIGDTKSPTGNVRLIYEEPEVKTNRDLYGHSIQHIFYDEFFGLDRGHEFQRVPHIDHVKFNGPATIVFWKDGTKTVVKHDGKGRKDKRLAILYAFIRKIYGEGRPYHDILNEIEEVMEQELWMPLPEKGSWIPVSEELPKKSGKYWCTFGGTNITGTDYYTTKSEAKKLFVDPEECIGWRSQNVIAWMPLPEPYKGGR